MFDDLRLPSGLNCLRSVEPIPNLYLLRCYRPAVCSDSISSSPACLTLYALSRGLERAVEAPASTLLQMADMDFNASLGSAFLGCLLSAILYGVTCVQAFNYHKGCFRDPRRIACFVYTLWVLETVHLALIAHGCYYYTVTNYVNPASLLRPAWSFIAQIPFSITMDLSVREGAFFARRIWILTRQHNPNLAKALVVCIGVMSLIPFASGTALTARAFILNEYAVFWKISFLLYTSLGSGVVADGLIATSMCILLSRSRTGLVKTDTIIDRLMLYSINTGLLTTHVVHIDYNCKGLTVFIGSAKLPPS
ncbi:hypothetical protein FB107DRAFT_271088 [Schizophyllum commune]